MARIPLAPRPQELNTGNRTVRTPRLEYSGGEAIARGIQVFGDNIVSIFEKKQKADDARVLIDQSLDFDREKLEYMQWRDAPENANDETKWEPEAYNRINRLREKYSQMPLSPDMRLQVEDRFNKWGVNFEIEAYAASFRRAGENVRTGLENVKQQSILNRDFSQYNQAIDDAVSRGVYTREGGEALKLDAQATEKSIKIQDLQNNVQADLDVGSFETARIRVQNAKDENLISEAEYNAQMSRLDNKIIYSSKLEELDVEIENNPAKVLNEIKTSQSGSNIPQSFLAKNTRYAPGKGETPAERRMEGGINDRKGGIAYTLEAYLRNEAPYVVVAMDDKILPYGTKLTNENFKDAEGKLIPFEVRDTGGAFKGQGFSKVDIATESLQDARTVTDRSIWNIVELPGKGRVEPTGELGWIAPKDREKVRINAEKQLAQKASDQFRTFKEAVDIGRISLIGPSADDDASDAALGSKPNPTDFESVISQPQFRELASDPQSRDAAEYYFNKELNKFTMNDSAEYEQYFQKITSYDVLKDPSGLAKAQLKNNISARFSDAMETELNKRLDDMASVSGTRNSMTKMSDALKQLNKIAFTDQGLGEYKRQTLAEVGGQRNRKISPEDIAANTLFMIDGVRRVPTQADIDANKMTGELRYIPQVTVKDVNYINIDGKLTRIKKGEITPIFEEDPEKRTEIASKAAAIRDQLEKEVLANPNMSREEVVRRMYELARPGISIPGSLNSTSSVPTRTMTVQERMANLRKGK